MSDILHIKHLDVTRKQASRGAALPMTTIAGSDELVPAKEVFKLRARPTYVDYWVCDPPPDWDDLDESDDEGDNEGG